MNLTSSLLPLCISYYVSIHLNKGSRILVRHSSNISTLSEKFDSAVDIDNKQQELREEGVLDIVGSRLLINAKEIEENNNIIEETELFLKQVNASSYTHKSWTDMRRTLVYLRTEVRFYNEIVPLLLSSCDDDDNDDDDDGNTLRKYLPTVHHADYNLDGLISEDCPTTYAKQPSPFVEETSSSDEEENERMKHQLLKDKGGHILLQSLSPTHGYFQTSPISLQQSLQCLTAVAELHASAWGNTKLLQTISNRLSSAGGSYQLSFRNPKELHNMVDSWEHFRGQFAGLNEKTASVLEKESIVKLGQRVHDMAEYVSKELSPSVDDEYATLVHGDYKAMVSSCV